MSIRNLDAVLRPKSIALIGASTREHSVGGVVARNLFGGGFAGPIMPVNPHHDAVHGVLAYPDVASLPLVPDLAVVCTPPGTVPGLVSELAARGTRGIVVITAGFGELGNAEGKALERLMLESAKPHLVRIVGPNCVGLLVPGVGLNASFAHIAPQRGGIAFVTQSGALVTAVLDWAAARRIGFSHLVSVGDMVDVDFGDLLDYLASDPDARAILLYVEAITHARKFMSAARAAARIKPVIVIKSGRHAESARAASSHTGALAGVDAVYDAAFRRAGMLRVYSLDELFDAVETLAAAPPLTGERLAILTNGGGMGVLATDTLIDLGGRLATLSSDTIKQLSDHLPRMWSHGDPVDIIGDAPGERYAEALSILLGSPEVDAVLVINCPTAIADPLDAARAVVGALGGRRRPVLTSWLGEAAAASSRALFAQQRISTYDTPDKAVRGFMHLVRYQRNQAMLMETPPSIPEIAVDAAGAAKVIAGAVAEGREWLNEIESKDVLAHYGIPVARTLRAGSPDEAAKAVAALGLPTGRKTALKILSRDITHKTDVGGVALDLPDAEAVRIEANAMLTRVKRAAPKARVEGFAVEEMIKRPGAYELLLGLVDDAQFGPVILFGHGGTAAEVVADRAIALPPLNLVLARELVSRTRIHALLQGYRDRPPAALDAICLTLVRLAQLATDLDGVMELDINPLLADSDGVVALDARVRVAAGSARRGAARLAIRPYPKELEEVIELEGLGRLLLRPVRPEDAPMFRAAFDLMSPEDIRLRFFGPIKDMGHEMAARLTQIDYDREMALIVVRPEEAELGARFLGVVRIAADPDNRRAEFAITVRSDLKGRGIGRFLMRRIVAYAKGRGIGEIFGDILSENQPMLDLSRRLGFTIAELSADHGIVRATLVL
jgi:acetyltransferase